MIKVILFDFDGTIADTFDNFILISNKLSEKYKFPKLNDEQVANLRAEDARTILKTFKIPFYRYPFLARDFKNMSAQTIEGTKPFEGLPEVLHRLNSDGFRLGLLTSNSIDNVTSFNKKFRLDIFDYIYTDVGLFGKAKAIRKFIKKNNLSLDEVIYVGDEIRDIKACKTAGVKIISATWGFNSAEGLKKYDPDFFCEKPEELLKIIKNNMKISNNT